MGLIKAWANHGKVKEKFRNGTYRILNAYYIEGKEFFDTQERSTYSLIPAVSNVFAFCSETGLQPFRILKHPSDLYSAYRIKYPEKIIHKAKAGYVGPYPMGVFINLLNDVALSGDDHWNTVERFQLRDIYGENITIDEFMAQVTFHISNLCKNQE